MATVFESLIYAPLFAIPLFTFVLRYMDKEKKLLLWKFLNNFRDFWTNRNEYYTKYKFIFHDIWSHNSLHVIFIFTAILVERLSNLAIHICNKWIVDKITDHQFCFHLIFATFFIKSFDSFLQHARRNSWRRISNAISRNVKLTMFQHAHEMTYHGLLDKKSGEVDGLINKSAQSTNNFIYNLIFIILPSMLDIILAMAYFIKEFRSFSPILFLTIVVYMGVTHKLTKRFAKLREQYIEADKQSRSIFSDSLSNAETVKYFVSEEFERSRFDDSIKIARHAESQKQFSHLVLGFLQNFIINASNLFVCIIMAYDVFFGENKMTASDFMLCTTYVGCLYSPLYYFEWIWIEWKEDNDNMDQMIKFLSEEIEADAEDAVDLPEEPSTISFNNVKFGYRTEKLILDDVSFKINPGETVALVGASGSGKTTIYRLLLRFFDVIEGSIKIGGKDIRKLTRKSLRKNFGIVSQDIDIFNESIGFNIKYGYQEASQKEIEEAARAAAIHDFIASQPDGYNTNVGQKGIKLSGGEKQRLSIARTILKNPKYILLDEATSALDTHTEHAIQNKLSELCRSRTSLIIAHRLTTIINANRIFVLKQGKIIENGTHNELLAKKGLYYEMWEQQYKSRKN